MAFCTQCGKEVEAVGTICDECLKLEEAEKPTSDASATPEFALPPKKTAAHRDMLLAALLIFPSLLLINSLFYGGVGLGLTVSVIFITTTSVWYAIGEKKKSPSYYTVVLLVLLILSALSLTFSDEGITKGLSVVAILLLYMIILTEYFGLRVRKAGTYRAFADVCETIFIRGLGKISDGVFALFRKSDEEGNITKRQTGKVFTGIIGAIPVLFVVVPLLISSDAAFEGMFKNISFNDVWELIVTFCFGTICFLSVFSRLFTMKDAKPAEKKESTFKGLEPISVSSFLGVVSAVYVIYLLSQFAYFFSAFGGLLPEDFTLAEYARRGFFEMCAVCAINLFIIFLSSVLCRKNQKGLPSAVKALNVFLGVFSLILIGTAISKMVLYIDRLGMTRLRIYTSVFMVFLGIVFITVLLKLFVQRIPYMKVILVTACSILLIACLVDTDRIIANYNVNAYLSGKLDSVDVDTLEYLDSSAIKPLLKLYRDGDKNTKASAQRALIKRLKAHFDITQHSNGTYSINRKDFDIRSFNLPEQLALNLLEDNWQSFFDYDIYSGKTDGMNLEHTFLY